MKLPPSGTRGSEIPKAVRPLLKLMSGVGGLMFRFGVKIQGQPLLRLTSVGARSGKERHVVLGYFDDANRPGSWLVVASNGGSARHPGWAHNLVNNPSQVTADTGEGAAPVDVELLEGEDRDMAWDRVVTAAPGYGAYTEKTDREIPIFRLTARQ